MAYNISITYYIYIVSSVYTFEFLIEFIARAIIKLLHSYTNIRACSSNQSSARVKFTFKIIQTLLCGIDLNFKYFQNKNNLNKLFTCLSNNFLNF